MRGGKAEIPGEQKRLALPENVAARADKRFLQNCGIIDGNRSCGVEPSEEQKLLFLQAPAGKFFGFFLLFFSGPAIINVE